MTLADRAAYARGPWQRLIGLLDRATLASGEGLIFAPCTGLHTIGMRFPIDLVYLRRAELDGKGVVVVRLQANLRPFRCAPARAEFALELLAGATAQSAAAIGDEIAL